MAGEIIKGTVNVGFVNGSTVNVVPDNNGVLNLNEIAAYNYDTDNSNVIALQTGLTTIDSNTPKLAVEQGKQFVTTQVRFDANVVSGSVANIIRDRIDEWIATNGARYDDFQVIINTSAGATHDITTIIVRYY